MFSFIIGYELAEPERNCDLSLDQEPIVDDLACGHAISYIRRIYKDIETAIKIEQNPYHPKGCYVNTDKNSSDKYGVYFNDYNNKEGNGSREQLLSRSHYLSNLDRFSENLIVDEEEETAINSSTTQQPIAKVEARKVCKLINRKSD